MAFHKNFGCIYDDVFPAEDTTLRGVGTEVEVSTTLAPVSTAAKENQASELTNTSSLSLRSTFPWSCPELEEFCRGASCKSGCPCPLIVGDTCEKVKRRNTGVSCNIMSCSFSSVSNAYCMGRFGNKICLCNPGMAFHKNFGCIYDDVFP